MKDDNSNDTLTGTPLFPTWLFCKDLANFGELNASLLALAYDSRDADATGRNISNLNGWQSEDNIHLKPAVSTLLNHINECTSEIAIFLSAAEQMSFDVKACWININSEGARNAPHIHGNSHFSGVYYINVPEGAGEIQFFDPNSTARQCFSFPFKAETLRNCHEVRYAAVEGRMLIFPGYLMHEVLENTGTGDRVSISFNIVASMNPARI
jgi:uncharacterized protein (TIGR02466 family)